MAADLDRLKKQGVEVRRYNLARDINAFATNAVIKGLLETEGPQVLPVTLVDGQVVKKNKYPSTMELEAWASPSKEVIQSDNLVDDTVRVLIALGAAIAANCGPCFRSHFNEARKLGIPVQDMVEAVEIGDNVRRAAGNSVIDVAERFLIQEKQSGGGCCGSKGGGCC
jgi:AhpD family alkylhydroperoxidase